MSNKQLIVLGSNSFLARSIPACFSASFSSVLNLSSVDFDLTLDSIPEACLEDWEPDAVILFFAVINKWKSDTREAYHRNISMAGNVAKLLKKKNAAACVFTSSADVYGIHPANPISENSQTDPDNWYAKAKLESEEILSQSLRDGVNLGIFRCTGLYNFNPDDNSVIGKFNRVLYENGTVILNNEGRNLRDFVHTQDFYKIIQSWVENPSSGTWNLVSGKSYSMLDVADLLRQKTGKGHIQTGGHDNRDFDLVFDTRRLKDQFPEGQPRSIFEVLDEIKTERDITF